MKNKLPTISIKNTATDDSSMIITVMHFSGILFVKVLINNAPNINAHWNGNNERQGKAITFNTTIKVRVIYIYIYICISWSHLLCFFVKHTSFFHHLFVFLYFTNQLALALLKNFVSTQSFHLASPKIQHLL